MKRIAVIGASYLQQPLVVKAKEMGYYTICFAWQKDAVCMDIADEFYPISVVEKEQIFLICQEKKIDGICTIASDVAAPTVAYVAEKMGLVGNTYEVALRANNKFQMRQVFAANGILCPHYQRVVSYEQLNSEGLRFPLVVKPTDRSGSLGVSKVERREDLKVSIETALNYSFKHEAVVEEFIEGKEISVEFISYQGVHYPLQITDKVTTGAPHFVELEHHQPSELDADYFSRVYDLTKKALDALGVTNGASHSEFKITKEGKIFVIEIGARMGGDFIGSDLVSLSTGYDYLKGVIEVSLGEFVEPVFGNRQYSGVYFLCENTKRLQYVIETANLPQIVRAEVTSPQLCDVKCSADRSGYLIYKGNKKLEI